MRRSSSALGLRAYLRQQNTELPARVGFSISQKISKRAVVRNRIKRQLRAAVRHLLPRVETGWDLVIVVRPDALQCDYFIFLQQLEQLLAQAKILHGN
jgi:ribonuclease P protein component